MTAALRRIRPRDVVGAPLFLIVVLLIAGAAIEPAMTGERAIRNNLTSATPLILAAFERLVARVIGVIEQPDIGIDLPLDVRGTAFQQRVWDALRAIPPGQTASYAQIAARIGSPKSVRAVAQACAANTLAVAIPCHRVVRSDGALSGYRWGVARKRALLSREGKQP